MFSFSVCECFALHVCLCTHMVLTWCPKKSEKNRSPGTVIKDSRELPCVFWGAQPRSSAKARGALNPWAFSLALLVWFCLFVSDRDTRKMSLLSHLAVKPRLALTKILLSQPPEFWAFTSLGRLPVPGERGTSEGLTGTCRVVSSDSLELPHHILTLQTFTSRFSTMHSLPPCCGYSRIHGTVSALFSPNLITLLSCYEVGHCSPMTPSCHLLDAALKGRQEGRLI